MSLEEAIEGKEQELKKYIAEAKKQADLLYKEIESTTIDPFILLEFFEWYGSLDFNHLKNVYKGLATNPEDVPIVESQIRKNIMAALEVLVSDT